MDAERGASAFFLRFIACSGETHFGGTTTGDHGRGNATAASETWFGAIRGRVAFGRLETDDKPLGPAVQGRRYSGRVH